MNAFKHIIWDWNGTLLNDVNLCVNIINILLAKRDLQQLTMKRYREIFTFPVQNYYLEAGFDFTKEPFEAVAHEFIVLYLHQIQFCTLNPNVEKILSELSQSNIKQYVLSAMQNKALGNSVKACKIDHYFTAIEGISDHYARSKADVAVKLFKNHQINPNHAVMIGDTLHDLEVAERLGCHCILYSGGHQSSNRFKNSGVTIANDFIDIQKLIRNIFLF